MLITLLVSLPFSASAATLTVNSSADTTLDDGECTLREAITSANANAASGMVPGECVAGDMMGNDTIGFSIPGAGPHLIQVGSALPNITSPITIDGYTQPGATPNSIVELDGFNAQIEIVIDGSQSGTASKPGLLIQGPGGSGTTIRGLEIAGFTSLGCCADSGIALTGNTLNIVIAGNILRDNKAQGVDALGGALDRSLRVGGPLPEDRNLIYGHSGDFGIRLIGCQSCIVENNWLGIRLDAAGTPVAAANGAGAAVNGGCVGCDIEIHDNWIGGNGDGLYLSSAGAQLLISANLIGGSIANGSGIWIGNETAVSFPTNYLIEGNTISGNSSLGIRLTNYEPGNGMIGHVLRGNRLYANGGLEIDLGANGGNADGVTANDPGDVDIGPNGLQNYPVLQPPIQQGGSLSIDYDLSAPAAAYDLEFSFSTACDPSGHGPSGSMNSTPVRREGMAAAGTTLVAVPPTVPTSGFISATATGAEGTSEFSPCVAYTFDLAIFANGFESEP